MNMSVEYKDGKLIIPHSVMEGYLKSLKTIRKSFTGHEGEIEEAEMRYELSSDSISLRIFDGELFPCVEISVNTYTFVDIQGNSVGKKGLMMKTFAGVTMIDPDLNVAAIMDGSNVFPEHRVGPIKGAYASIVSKQIKVFGKAIKLVQISKF